MLKHTLCFLNNISRKERRLLTVAHAAAQGGRGARLTYTKTMKELQQIQQRRDRRTGPRSSAQPRPSTAVRRQYDTVEPSTGNSATQLRFNQLVRDALLRFGPPLPAEFVGDNKIVTTSSSKDLGADGKSFEAVDEVKLKIYELYDVLLKHKPTFSLEEDCDGVPLSLMVKNCNYLRSHEGKVCYMRYLRREEMENGKRALVLSIGKYKMREHPSQDGVRQGPQPWLYKYGMTIKSVLTKMKSILALINAKKIYKGAPVLDRNAPSVYPPEVNAILMVDGRIHRIGTTKEVCALYESLTPSLEKTTEEAPVEGGRKRASSARQVDCLGKYTLYPGFVESHAHFLDGGRSINNPWLENACSQEEFITILRDFTEHRYTGTGWIFGGGWSEPVLGGCPTRHWLDTVSTDIPMVLYRKDVHTCVLNTAALRICHVLGEEEPIIRNVSGGRIELDEAGEPNGILRDNAIHAVAKYFPPTDSPLNKESALHSATEYYLSRGFTTVFSMMSTQFKDHTADVLFLKDAERKGDLRIRVRYGAPLDSLSVVADTLYTPVKDSGRTDTFTLPHRFTCIPPQEGGSFFFLGAIKLFGDGALGSRTAAMNRPYGYNVQTEGDINSELEDVDIEKILVDPNRPECQCGLLIMQRGELQEAVRAVHARGLQVVAHGIGDRAVANVNKALCDSGRALRSAPDQTAFHQDPRSRVEHCQHIGNVSKEVSRMQECHIIASMQPCHLLFDGDYVEDLIGINRKNKSYLWGTFLKHNIRVNLGSDWPVAPADVCDGLRGAVTRVPDVMASLAAEKNGKTLPEGTKRYHEVWSKEECISMDDALRCYTYEAAHGAFLEDVVGSLEEGKYADVTVWSDDWLDSSNMVPLGDSGEKWWRPADQPELLYTIVGGNIEFQKQ